MRIKWWRRLRASNLKAWRRANPMCSACGCRFSSGVNTPPECSCYYLWIRENI